MIRSEVWRRSSTWTWGFTKKVLFWFIGQQFGVNALSAEEELQEQRKSPVAVVLPTHLRATEV